MDVDVVTVAARTLAAVRRQVAIGAVGTAWRSALDEVWAFVRANPGLHAGGHNVFVYHHPARRDEPMQVDFGVEVTRAFEPSGDVVCATTASGEIAQALHVGPYEELARTHAAIHAWQPGSGRRFAGLSWEIYGDWSDDPRALETTVCYLLA